MILDPHIPNCENFDHLVSGSLDFANDLITTLLLNRLRQTVDLHNRITRRWTLIEWHTKLCCRLERGRGTLYPRRDSGICRFICDVGHFVGLWDLTRGICGGVSGDIFTQACLFCVPESAKGGCFAKDCLHCFGRHDDLCRRKRRSEKWRCDENLRVK